MEKSFDFPTEVLELPSKGLVYPQDSPLSSGKVELKYMTAKEEDILSNTNYLKDGTVIDKLLQSLLVTKFNYDDLLIGDKNAILLAARILGYGSEYTFTVSNIEYTIDLSTVENKVIDESIYIAGKNEFDFQLPHSGNNITFKLLTHKDQKLIDEELKGLLKINKEVRSELTTRLKHLITSIEGDRDKKNIREFVDNYLLARDSKALRDYVKQIQPDVDAKFYPDGGPIGGIDIPFGVTFLWPDA